LILCDFGASHQGLPARNYVELFKRVKVNAAPGVVPPVASTDGVNFDRMPTPEERPALLAYLRKL
jgi:hypothetical protein